MTNDSGKGPDKFPIQAAVRQQLQNDRLVVPPVQPGAIHSRVQEQLKRDNPTVGLTPAVKKRVRHESLSVEKRERFEDRFNEIDHDHDGVIKKDCILKALEKSDSKHDLNNNKDTKMPQILTSISPPSILDKKAEELIQESDLDGDGKVTKDEFIDFMHRNDKRTRKIFRGLDTDRDGKLTVSDIINHEELRHLNLSESDAVELLKTFLEPGLIEAHTIDGHLEITKEEFTEWHISELIDSRHTESKIQDGITDLFRDMTHKLSVANIEPTAYAEPIPRKKKLEKEKKFMIPYETFIYGGIAGTISRTATAPIDRLKVFFQVHERSPRKGYIQTLQFMTAEGGVKSLWRGNFVNVMKVFPETALKFGMYETLKNKMCDGEPTSTERFLSGAIAGAIAQTCIYPMEVIKTRMVLRSSGQYTSLLNCVSTIYQKEGIRTFGRGYIPTVFGILPYAGLDLLFAETTRNYTQRNSAWAVNKDGNLYWFIPFLIGGTSSMFAGSIVYPVNVIRTKMQAMRPKDYSELGSPKAHKAPYVRQICSEIIQDFGFRGFYAGIGANLTKAVCASSITFGIWEYLKTRNDYKSK